MKQGGRGPHWVGMRAPQPHLSPSLPHSWPLCSPLPWYFPFLCNHLLWVQSAFKWIKYVPVGLGDIVRLVVNSPSLLREIMSTLVERYGRGCHHLTFLWKPVGMFWAHGLSGGGRSLCSWCSVLEWLWPAACHGNSVRGPSWCALRTWDRSFIIRTTHALSQHVQGGKMDGFLWSTQRGDLQEPKG